MPQSKTEFYYHFVWATWQRNGLVTEGIERRLYRCIASEVLKLKGTMLEINGMPDHIHLVVQLPGTVAPSNLMQTAKGVSSTFARAQLTPGEYFGWQDGYAGFTVSRQNLQTVINYVRNQKRHHADNTTIPDWEDCGGIDEDRRQTEE